MKKVFVTVVVLCFIFAGQLNAQEKMVKFLISTDFGDIKGVLYNDTPQHRDNFIKLVEDGWYNGSIFHRVINNFMIQGGQSASGQPDPGYKIPAEILPQYYHKKGALAAARMGDNVNPQRASSGSQFYIVHGQQFNEATLDMMEQNMGATFSEAQRRDYASTGGAPHLDGQYTVFGQVVEGFDVIDQIAATRTGAMDRPVEEVKMTISIIK